MELQNGVKIATHVRSLGTICSYTDSEGVTVTTEGSSISLKKIVRLLKSIRNKVKEKNLDEDVFFFMSVVHLNPIVNLTITCWLYMSKGTSQYTLCQEKNNVDHHDLFYYYCLSW